MLAILTSHPIQYQAPLWRALAAAQLPVQVWFLTNHGFVESRDVGFGRSFTWDLDLMSGFPSKFLDVGTDWDMARFRGVRLRESLVERLRQEHIRVLWIEGWRFQAHWQAVRAARMAGVKVWLRGESNDLKAEGRLKSLVKRPILGRMFRQVDKFLCIGSANKRLYKSYGVLHDKLESAPYCVDNDRFRAEVCDMSGEQFGSNGEWRRTHFASYSAGSLFQRSGPWNWSAPYVKSLRWSLEDAARICCLSAVGRLVQSYEVLAR